MALWFWLFSLLQLFVLAQSQTIDQFNQTDLQAAMADMRGKSYHGFVILLKILEASPNTLNSQDITFLMPTDDKVSDIALTPAHLEDFILSHSIPMGLLYGNMLHFPNGTLVPSGMPNRMLRITNSGKSGMFVNNARITTPNVCMNSTIKCHGINSAITYNNVVDVPENMATNFRALDSRDLRAPVSRQMHARARKFSPYDLEASKSTNLQAPVSKQMHTRARKFLPYDLQASKSTTLQASDSRDLRAPEFRQMHARARKSSRSDFQASQSTNLQASDARDLRALKSRQMHARAKKSSSFDFQASQSTNPQASDSRQMHAQARKSSPSDLQASKSTDLQAPESTAASQMHAPARKSSPSADLKRNTSLH